MDRHRAKGRRGRSAARMASIVACLAIAMSGCATPEVTSPGPVSPPTTQPGSAAPGVTPDPLGEEPFSPGDLAFAPDGTLYATDCGGGRVYRVATGAAPVSVVGLGSEFQAFDGEGGPAWAAHLQCPWGIAFDRDGRMLVVDHGHGRVRRVEPDGRITTIVGGGGDHVTGDSPAVRAILSEPQSIAVDADGDLYVSDRSDRVFRIDAAGQVEVLAGTGEAGFSGDGGPATKARFDNPAGLAFDATGNLFVADTYNGRIRRIDPNGDITTVVGTGEPTSMGDGGPAIRATVAEPYSVLFDAAGNLLIGETGEDRSFAFSGSGNRYRRVTPDGRIEAFAGTGAPGYAGDGAPAVEALLAAYDSNMGMAMDATGRIYLADSGNHAVRVVGTDGIISTFSSQSHR